MLELLQTKIQEKKVCLLEDDILNSDTENEVPKMV